MTANIPRPEEIVERCRALAPVLFDRAPEAERLRHCPDESIEDYFAIGLDRLLKPARYGGWQMGWDMLCETALALAHGCAAQGWVLTIYGDHAQHLGMFDKRAQDEVWADPRALVSTSFGAQGAAKRVAGGAVLTGNWGFSSGIDHARWIMAGSLLHDGDGGEPVPMVFLLPKSDVAVIDDWQVMGLAGTGSKSFRIDEAFVPTHRMLPAIPAAEGTPSPDCGNDAPIFRTPRRSTAGFALGCVGVGAAQGMLDAFVAAQRGRVSRGIALAEEQWMQLVIAEASATLRAAALLAVTDARETMARCAGREPIPVALRAVDKRDASYITRLARDTADRLFGVAGGTALHESNVLQRYFRDIHAATSHFGLRWEHSAVPYARLALGLAPGPGYY
jgi:3-hydroxy-9,10-secoandrosta-1,3,5(10)-triene-9,17-dione monooxygenase